MIIKFKDNLDCPDNSPSLFTFDVFYEFETCKKNIRIDYECFLNFVYAVEPTLIEYLQKNNLEGYEEILKHLYSISFPMKERLEEYIDCHYTDTDSIPSLSVGEDKD